MCFLEKGFCFFGEEERRGCFLWSRLLLKCLCFFVPHCFCFSRFFEVFMYSFFMKSTFFGGREVGEGQECAFFACVSGR